jgi:uracil-DNA glycosylase family 4
VGVEADPDERRALLSLLAYYRALGVDCAIDSVPHDRFEESRRPPAPAPREQAPPPRVIAAPLAADEVTAEAQRIAGRAHDLAALAQGLAGFEALGMSRGARHFLFAEGEPRSRVMAMEVAPGEEEERSGAPFCGAEARLLEAMLKSIGVARSEAYLAYFAPWRSAGGQAPAPHLIEALTPFARRHIALAKPRALLLFGDFAWRVLGVDKQSQPRRIDLRFDDVEVAAFVAPGLSSILKSPAVKRQAWKALRTLIVSPGLHAMAEAED